MNNKVVVIIGIIAIISALLAASLLLASLFIVDKTEQAIVTQFGKFVREVKQPGLHFKIPLIQAVHRFEDAAGCFSTAHFRCVVILDVF